MNSFETLTWRWTSLVAQMVKNLPTMQETRVQSLGQEDPLEKAMATHSSILAWEIPWPVEPGGATIHWIARVRNHLATKQHHQNIYASVYFYFTYIYCKT